MYINISGINMSSILYTVNIETQKEQLITTKVNYFNVAITYYIMFTPIDKNVITS